MLFFLKKRHKLFGFQIIVLSLHHLKADILQNIYLIYEKSTLSCLKKATALQHVVQGINVR